MDINALLPFFCHFCDFLAYDLAVLKYHKGTHASASSIYVKDKVYKCTFCSQIYYKKDKLKVHMDSVHKGIRHICDQCGKSHKYRNGLKSHILFIHEKQQKPEQKKYKCTQCQKKFAKIYLNCKDHIKTCKKCGYITNYQKQLQKHQISTNCTPSKSKKTIKCGKCGDMFTTEKYMKKHEISHTNGKPHKCQDCGVGFSERTNIKKHNKNNCRGSNNSISIVHN